MRARAAKLIVLAVGLMGCVAAPAAAAPPAGSILQDGDFETPVVTGTWEGVGPGEALGAWTATGDGVDHLGSLWPAASGAESVDLNHTAAGGVRQTVSTVAGRRYVLSLSMSENAYCGIYTAQALVMWDGRPAGQFRFTPPPEFDGVSEMAWQRKSVTLTATRATSTLELVSQNGGECGPAIDDVSLVPTGPTPAGAQWSFERDFRTGAQAENPSRDAYDNGGVWQYLAGAPADQDADGRLVRDPGGYALLDTDSIRHGQLETWATGELPLAARNTGAEITVQDGGGGNTTVPAGATFLHPAPGQVAVAKWVAPVGGTFPVLFKANDLDTPDGNGFEWAVHRGDTRLAAGTVEEGGAVTWTSPAPLTMSTGDTLYFTIGPSFGDWTGDSTRVQIEIGGTGPRLTASPASVDFGDVVVGAASTRKLTLSNGGTDTIDLDDITPAGLGPFGVTDTQACLAPLPAGGSCDVTVRYAPGAVQGDSGEIRFRAGGTTYASVPVTGRGVAASLSASPSRLRFGAVVAGTTSKTKAVTLTNTSAGDVRLDSVTAGQPFAAAGCAGQTLAPGASCQVDVSFAPTATGPATAILRAGDLVSLPLGGEGIDANLLVNGDFEWPLAGASTELGLGDEIDGWTVSGGSVSHVGTEFAAGSGAQSMDLNGLAPGAVSQAVSTTPGRRYRLSFRLSENTCGASTDPPPAAVRVLWDGEPAAEMRFPPAGGPFSWPDELAYATQVVHLTARDASSKLEFVSRAPADGACGPVIDDVRLVPADPTPAGTEWHFERDFRAGELAENPIRDMAGNAGVWQLMTSAEMQPDERGVLPRDPAGYTLDGLEQPGTGINGLAGTTWFGGYPFFVKNPGDGELSSDGITVPPGGAFVDPGPTGRLAVVKWVSPVAGTFDVALTATDIDPGDGDGVEYAVHRGITELQADDVPEAGSRAWRSPSPLTVAVGDALYFTVGAHGGGYGDSTRLQVDITPAAPRSALTATPASLAFGKVSVQHAKTLTVDIANSGPPVTLDSLVANPAPAYAVNPGTCRGTLASGASCRASVTFEPGSVAGARPADLVVRSGSTTVLTVPLSATAVPAKLTGRLDFGDVTVGETAQQTLTIANDGEADVEPLSVQILPSGPFSLLAGTTCKAVLAPGATCTAPVAFHPTTAGAAAAHLDLIHTLTLASLDLAGTGVVPPPPSLAATPAALKFGLVRTGTTSPPKAVTITNAGGPVTLTDVAFSGPFSSPDERPCTRTLGTDQSCTLAVTYSPQTLTADAGELKLMAGATPTLSVPLAGTGTDSILVNGDFEWADRPTAFTAVGPGDASLVGWTITGAGIDHVGDTFPPASGMQSVDLNDAGVEQTVPTTAGTRYRLRFRQSVNGCVGATPSELKVVWDGVLVAQPRFDPPEDRGCHTSDTWVERSMFVTAVDASTTLAFTSALGAGAAHGPAIDAVTLAPAPASPRPASWSVEGDFRADASEDPLRDANDNAGVWQFLQSTGAARDPLTYTRDGLAFGTALKDNPVVPFFADGDSIFAKNTTAVVQTVATATVPAHAFYVHPAAGRLAVVRWLSPINGTVDVAFTATDIDAHGQGGVGYAIHRGATALAGGAVAEGGSAAKSLSAVPVSIGDSLYFTIDDAGDYLFDSTRLQIQISETVPAHFSADAVALGAVSVGHTKTVPVTITNDGGPGTISGVTIDSSAYSVSAPGCGALAHGASCTASVTFAPAAAGSQPTTLRVKSGASTVLAVPVTGTGVAVSVAGGPLDFGAVAVGSSATKDLVVTNTGAAPVQASAAQVGAGGPFTLASAGNCLGQLAPGASCAASVTFTPTAAGPASGTFTLARGTTSFASTLALKGTGTTPPPPPAVRGPGLSINAPVAKAYPGAFTIAAGCAGNAPGDEQIVLARLTGPGIDRTYTAAVGPDTGVCGGGGAWRVDLGLDLPNGSYGFEVSQVIGGTEVVKTVDFSVVAPTKPAVRTDCPIDTGSFFTTLIGIVNPGGLATSYRWLVKFDTGSAWTVQSAPTSLPAGTTDRRVRFFTIAPQLGTTRYALEATNARGTVTTPIGQVAHPRFATGLLDGPTSTPIVVPCALGGAAPVATTLPETARTGPLTRSDGSKELEVTLNARANAKGRPATYRFEYQFTLGSRAITGRVMSVPEFADDNVDHTFSVRETHWLPGATLKYRAVAVGPGGFVAGAWRTLTSACCGSIPTFVRTATVVVPDSTITAQVYVPATVARKASAARAKNVVLGTSIVKHAQPGLAQVKVVPKGRGNALAKKLARKRTPVMATMQITVRPPAGAGEPVTTRERIPLTTGRRP